MACTTSAAIRGDYEDDASSCVGVDRRTTRSASPTSGSVTDVSEDSVEVKIQPVAAMPLGPSASTAAARRNKRKSTEPRKLKDTTNVPVTVTSNASTHSTGTCKQQRFWSAEKSTAVEREPSGSNVTDRGGHHHGRVPPTDAIGRIKDAGGDGLPAVGNQFPRPHKTFSVVAEAGGTTRSRSSKSGAVVSGAPTTVTSAASAPCITVGRTNRRVGATKDRSSTSSASANNSAIRNNRAGNVSGRNQQRHLPASTVATRNANLTCDTLSNDEVTSLPAPNRSPFLLNLPFDVRNILGPSAASLLQSTTCAASASATFPAASSSNRRNAYGDDVSRSNRDVISVSARDAILSSSRDIRSARDVGAGSVRDVISGSARDVISGFARDAILDSNRVSTVRDSVSGPDSGLAPSGEDADSPFRHFRNLLLSDRMLQNLASAEVMDDDDDDDEQDGGGCCDRDAEDEDDKEVRELVRGNTAKRKRSQQLAEVGAAPLADGGGVNVDYNEESSRPSSSLDYSNGGGGGSGGATYNKQRNYKNMTRERRVEANARERTRVHTISSAFEELRRAVPSYSCHQKLSKLAILRIACSYILALASLNDLNYSGQPVGPTFAECVDQCTQTIQAEGKARKRKD